MDERTGWCRGCYRTLNEIALWGQASEVFQQTVLQQLPQRRSVGMFPEAQLNPAVIQISQKAQP